MKRINNERFFTGINYWSSKNAIRMWEDFDEKSIEEDFAVMAQAGITHLRVFPLWSVFQPITAECEVAGVFEYRFGNLPLPDTEAGRAGVSEEACVKFEKFCRLADKYNFKLIVGLITGHMSAGIFAPPAFVGRRHAIDPTVIKWQIRFVKYFVKRFKDQSSIVGWDLGNEVNCLTVAASTDQFYVWCATIADAIRSVDGDRPVISGTGDPKKMIENGRGSLKELCEICDIHTYHPYNCFSTQDDPITGMKPILDLAFKCRLGEDVGKKPTFIQEFGSIGYLTCSYKSEAAFYRAALLSGLAHGVHGVMWWCAFDQGQFDFPPYDWNNRGSDYGFFDAERKPKPIVEENLKFKKLLEKIPEGNLPPHDTEGVIVVPRDDGDANEHILRTAYILGKQANLDLGFTYALDKIPKSKLYIMPSLAQVMSIPKRRLDEILENVKDGSVLYVSLGTAFFRSIHELFGVVFESREAGTASKTLFFKGNELPVNVDASYTVESVEAEVLGCDGDGVPMFFKYKYGKGCIYLLTAPIEKYAATRKGTFFAENQPKYSEIYRELAKTAGIERIADSDNEFVRLTEHSNGNDEYYVFAINYSGREQKAKISLKPEYTATAVFGSEIGKDGFVSLPPCDGSLYSVKRMQ